MTSHLHVMTEHESRQQLYKYRSRCIFLQATLADDVFHQIYTRYEIHDQIQLMIGLDDVMELYDVFVS